MVNSINGNKFLFIMINIPRGIEDKFYRYKMQQVDTKVEGRGNGIKTSISNLCAVAKALDRPPSYICKYLGIELGAQTQMYEDDKRYIISGKFEAVRLQDLLDGFIEKFVLCNECGNPETRLRVTSKKLIESKCIACGYRCIIPMVHKLTTFIINNPPQVTIKVGRDLNIPRCPCAVIPTLENQGDDDDDEWSVDSSEEGVKARCAELQGLSHITVTTDSVKPLLERLEIFDSFVRSKLDIKPFPSLEVIHKADELECGEKGVMVLVQRLWSNSTDLMVVMKQYQGLFQRFLMDKPKAQMYALEAMEKIIELHPSKLEKTPRFLKKMYDLDLVDDEVFIAWGEKPKKSVNKDLALKIREVCVVFLEWIKTAEVEESSDDETVTFESVPIVIQFLTKKVVEDPTLSQEDNDIDIDAM